MYYQYFLELKDSNVLLYYGILGVFVLIVCLAIWQFIDGVILNAISPLIIVDAKIVGRTAKRTGSNSSRSYSGHSYGSTAKGRSRNHFSSSSGYTKYSYVYTLVFETDDRTRISFNVPKKVYDVNLKGDIGELSYKRRWFKDFDIV